MPFFIGAECIDVMDRSCIEECPVDCIYEGDRKLYINPRECIDCAACESACPVEAISSDRKAGPERLALVKDNAAFFAVPLPGRESPLGNPGGAAKVGPVGADTRLVTEWSA